MKFCLPAVEPYMNDGSHFHPIKKDLNGKDLIQNLNLEIKYQLKIYPISFLKQKDIF